MYTPKLKNTNTGTGGIENYGARIDTCISYPVLVPSNFSHNKKVIKLYNMYTGLKLDKPLSSLRSKDLITIIEEHTKKLYTNNLPVVEKFCNSVINNLYQTNSFIECKNLDKLLCSYSFSENNYNSCAVSLLDMYIPIVELTKINQDRTQALLRRIKSFVFLENFILKYLHSRNTLNPFSFGLFKYFVAVYYTKQINPHKDSVYTFANLDGMNSVWEKHSIPMHYVVFPLKDYVEDKYTNSITISTLHFNNLNSNNTFKKFATDQIRNVYIQS